EKDLAEATQDAVTTYLESWEPWKRFKRREAFPKLELIPLQEIFTPEEWICCISLNAISEGVLYHGNLYAYDSLLKIFVQDGLDPQTRTKFDLAELRRVLKPRD
ncbi:MAG: hypothetical protein KDK48_06335, partial [Chlamydiia bacterium]|nr:hypothetical protein [Chlamydiia bacterium]